MASIVLDHASKTFEGRGTRAALADVSLNICEGDWITVVGSNGSGKTTLLNVISGLTRLDSGRVVVGNSDVAHTPLLSMFGRIGRVSQSTSDGVAGTLTVFENLSLASRRRRLPTLNRTYNSSTRQQYVLELAKFGLGLERRLGDRAGDLSGGQRQCVALVMALLGKPEIVLLDEHTAALDPRTADTVMNATALYITSRRLTCVMTVHDMTLALSHGTRVLMLHEGRVILDASDDERARLSPLLLKQMMVDAVTGESHGR
jgi:putative ABC transport system ATP-binding protein